MDGIMVLDTILQSMKPVLFPLWLVLNQALA